MTGFITGTTQPLSALTARSLRDLGYVVDATKADSFSLSSPGRRLRGSRANGFHIGNDLYTGPVFRFDRESPKAGREKEYLESKQAYEDREKRLLEAANQA
jgi:hypothetical protein